MVQGDVHHVEAVLADVAVIGAEHGHAARALRDAAGEAEARSPGVALREEPFAEVRRREQRPHARQRRVTLEVEIELRLAFRRNDVPRAVDAFDLALEPERHLVGPRFAEHRAIQIARCAEIAEVHTVVEAPVRFRIGPRVEQCRELGRNREGLGLGAAARRGAVQAVLAAGAVGGVRRDPVSGQRRRIHAIAVQPDVAPARDRRRVREEPARLRRHVQHLGVGFDAVRDLIRGPAEHRVAIERNVGFERQNVLDELAKVVDVAERVVTPIVCIGPRRRGRAVVAVRTGRGARATGGRAVAERRRARVQGAVLVPEEVRGLADPR